MRSIHQMLLLTVFAFSAMCVNGEANTASPAAEASGIAGDFEAALDLWRDGRYGELYDRTYAPGAGSREAFMRRMSAKSRKPACCWQKLQDLKILGIHGNNANISARVGIEDLSGETEYCTRSFRLKREEGVWKVCMADIMSLAGRNVRKRVHSR
ncbi:MAG: hypothetical protein VB050_15375 [Geobacteraceae bacterium]|nr:hypothetical protein [Geobacteraceae bacterium]